jgi:hypothetical protein
VYALELELNKMEINLNAEAQRRLLALATLFDQSIESVVTELIERRIEMVVGNEHLIDGRRKKAEDHPDRSGATWHGEVPKRGELAGMIRQHVLDNVIVPARARGEREVSVRAGEIHRHLGLRNRLPAVCAALGATVFSEMASVKVARVSGPANGATTEFTFQLVVVDSRFTAGVADLRAKVSVERGM